jgi:hypothetical protein
MALHDLALQFPKETVLCAGGSFDVRGLSLSDITVLVGFHKERLTELFDQFAIKDANGLKQLSPDASLDFGATALTAAPLLVAHVIAMAEERPHGQDPAISVALKLPVDVQIDAIEKILKLTFSTEGGPKKVLETVVRAVVGTTKFATGLKT